MSAAKAKRVLQCTVLELSALFPLSCGTQHNPAPPTDADNTSTAGDRVVARAGSAVLKEGFTLTNDGWVANELIAPPETTPPSAKTAFR